VPSHLKKKQSAKQKSAKTSPKKQQFSIKTSPKTSNPQVFKKNRNSTKKQAQIPGQTTRLATLQSTKQAMCFEFVM